jgi:acetolactate decarboxylase
VKEIKSMEVFVTENVKAPFFGYDNIHEWKEISLSKQVKDLKSLEKFIDQYNRSNDLPFFFKLEGKIKDANIHIVNLPAGSVVKSPDDAHQGQVNYQLKDKLVTLIGFFSRKHKAVFTHHDTFMHIHLITQDKDMMGHLEEITFLAKDFKLFIPANIGQ